MWSDWKIYERGGVVFSTLEPHTEGFFGAPPKGREFYYVNRALIGYKGQHLYWCYGQPEYRKLALGWIARWVKEGERGSYAQISKQRYQTGRRWLLKTLNRSLATTPKGLLTHFETANQYLLLHSRTAAISIDAFDDYFSEVVMDKLKKAGYGKVCGNKEDWPKLMQPAYRSVVMDYKLAIINLALSIIQKRIRAKSYDRTTLRGLTSRPFKAQLRGNDITGVEQILKKCFWLTMGWSGTTPLSERDIYQEIRKCARMSVGALQKERDTLLTYAKDIAKKRAEVIKKYRIPAGLIQPYLRILDAFARLHDERKEIQMRTLYAMDQVRQAVARQFRMTLQDVQMLKIEEIYNLLKNTGAELPSRRKLGSLLSARIKNRKIGYARIFKNGRTVREVEGRAAFAIIDKALALPSNARGEIKGVVASPGYAVGRAVVTDDPKEAMRLIKKGDILITSMTTPDFVPAMRKAGGVVTNEGGVTVHAAIVSREFGIPCITGTIHATHVFKTGQRVEVDATRGVVKKVP